MLYEMMDSVHQQVHPESVKPLRPSYSFSITFHTAKIHKTVWLRMAWNDRLNQLFFAFIRLLRPVTYLYTKKDATKNLLTHIVLLLEQLEYHSDIFLKQSLRIRCRIIRFRNNSHKMRSWFEITSAQHRFRRVYIIRLTDRLHNIALLSCTSAITYNNR